MIGLFNKNAPLECKFINRIFPAGETYINIFGTEHGFVDVFYSYGGDQTLFELAHFVDAARRRGMIIETLYCPYFPGARQDRVCKPGDSFALKIYADFINNLNFKKVVIFDAHSDVAPALINNCVNVSNVDFVVDIIAKDKDYYLVSPDAGSNKKIYAVSRALGGAKVIRADKVRDLNTGEIIDTEVFSEDLGGKNCYIIDDICSGGRTFIELAKKLKEKNAGRIELIVSHFENILNLKEAEDAGISAVHTTDSLDTRPPIPGDFVNYYEVIDYLTA